MSKQRRQLVDPAALAMREARLGLTALPSPDVAAQEAQEPDAAVVSAPAIGDLLDDPLALTGIWQPVGDALVCVDPAGHRAHWALRVVSAGGWLRFVCAVCVPPADPCWMCGQRAWWHLGGTTWLCAVCHPDAEREVARWQASQRTQG